MWRTSADVQAVKPAPRMDSSSSSAKEKRPSVDDGYGVVAGVAVSVTAGPRPAVRRKWREK